MDEEKTPHQRRPHYKGRYPRKFGEKYKELNPEKYADTIDKVERKGSTPAGMHIPIMVVLIAGIVAPISVALIGSLMFGNVIKVSGVVDDRIRRTLVTLVVS